ncbi:hypothetical protein HYT55_05015 [Candidatus Woesearchaeota archaeon]|nr:hypothetical protein [Candidatus Woesearchaeota archaeon]
MKTIDDLPRFTAVDYFSSVIGSSSREARVFLINKQRGLVAKVYKSLYWLSGDDYPIEDDQLTSPEAIHYARRECMVAERLYSTGVSVPRPEGVFALSLPSLQLPLVPGFVMEHIFGKSYYSLPVELCGRAVCAFSVERKKAIAAGFTPVDLDYDHNVLYTPFDDGTVKATIFDFGGWEHPELSRWQKIYR